MPAPAGASPFYDLLDIYEIVFDVPFTQALDERGRPRYTDSGTPVAAEGSGKPVTVECHVKERSNRGVIEQAGLEVTQKRLKIRPVYPLTLPDQINDLAEPTGTLDLRGKAGNLPGRVGEVRLLPTPQSKIREVAQAFGRWIDADWTASGG